MKFTKQNLISSVLSALMLAGLVSLSSTNLFAQEKSEKPNSKLARKAKITMEQAREIALKNAPGKIESEELEREHGKLVYSFDIRNSKGTITEVQVDAKTGQVVSVEEESEKDEMLERRNDEKQNSEKQNNENQNNQKQQKDRSETSKKKRND